MKVQSPVLDLCVTSFYPFLFRFLLSHSRYSMTLQILLTSMVMTVGLKWSRCGFKLGQDHFFTLVNLCCVCCFFYLFENQVVKVHRCTLIWLHLLTTSSDARSYIGLNKACYSDIICYNSYHWKFLYYKLFSHTRDIAPIMIITLH